MTDRSAAAIAADVANGLINASAVVEAHLEAIDRAADLNAFTLVEPDAAMNRANELDMRRRAGETLGPLAGVPIALKDLIDHAGRTTTCGSSFYRHVAQRSATVVDRLEAADAVIVGRAGLHEFAYGFSSENHWWGPVRNPWDTTTSPGGSSGGSAAAVAAGLCPIGIGTDTGGSVRVPAALCGVVGLKVTHGRIPLTGVFPLAPSLDTVGPITRSVGDAALAYRVMAGDDPTDPWSIPGDVDTPRGPADLTSVRIAVPHPWVDRPLGPGVAEAFRTALDRMAEAGAAVEDVDAPTIEPPGMTDASAYPEIAVVHRAWFTEDPERYGANIRDRMSSAMSLDLVAYTDALAWRSSLRNATQRLWERHDILVTPATPVTVKHIGEELVETTDGPEGYRPRVVVVRSAGESDRCSGPGSAARRTWVAAARPTDHRSEPQRGPIAGDRSSARGPWNH